jgi:hypothetical protein
MDSVMIKMYKKMTKEELLEKITQESAKNIELKRKVMFYETTLDETGVLLSLLDNKDKLEFVLSPEKVVQHILKEHRTYARESNMEPRL